jgi:thiamine biosynthesis protein ThiS
VLACSFPREKIEAMKLHINGEESDLETPLPPAQFTLAALIESLAMKSDRVAVELNREIAPRDRWSQTVLKDGDRLEIVHFVGGGSLPDLPEQSRGSDGMHWSPPLSAR